MIIFINKLVMQLSINIKTLILLTHIIERKFHHYPDWSQGMDDNTKDQHKACVVKVMVNKIAKADKGQTIKPEHMNSVNSGALPALMREHNIKCFQSNSREVLLQRATFRTCHISIHLDILTTLAVLLAKLFYSQPGKTLLPMKNWSTLFFLI